MFEKLSESNRNIVFDIKNWDHTGWHRIYRDKEKIEWGFCHGKNKYIY